jgi:tripartite-type tricarboxylate transporter receptor subunit TctC
MHMRKINLLLTGLLGLAALVFGAGALAAYPEKPIRIIVPYPPGGMTDILARAIGQKLGDKLGQPVVIDNRAGAGGTIGSNIAAKSAPDGYTLILGTFGTHAVNYALVEKLPYHPLKDFTPVIPVATVPNVLVVPTTSPIMSLADVLAQAREKPGRLSHASTGIGASPQLSLQLLKMMAKVDILEVMYKGGAPALTDLLAGHVTLAFDAVGTSIPQIKAGKLRPLVVTSSQRVKALPDVPTVAESGYPGFDVAAWYAFWAPAGTPPDIVRKLNEEINLILQMPDILERLFGFGAEVMGGSVEAFTVFHQKEFERWTTFVKAVGIKAD